MDVNKNNLSGSDLFALQEKWSEEEIRRLPARTLAYIGDAVYELGLRLRHVRRGIDDAGRLHDSVVTYVSSEAQARVFELLYPDLPEADQELVRCWRNAKISAKYGSGTRGEYARATALEAWVAYLFLTDQTERLKQIFELALETRYE